MQQCLQKREVPAADMRLYVAEEILNNKARFMAGGSWLAKVVDALTADHEARRRYFANAQAGGTALWLYAPTRHDANRLVRLLADHHTSYIRHDSNEGGVQPLGRPLRHPAGGDVLEILTGLHALAPATHSWCRPEAKPAPVIGGGPDHPADVSDAGLLAFGVS
jgi:hypothetical protein